MTNRPVALVTGANRGIGRAIAVELSSTHRILVGGRDAARVGELVAERALEAGISAVVFDRGGNKYHGRVAAVAEGARSAGLTL